MKGRRYSKRRLLFYLIPFLMGLGGVVFSQELTGLALRSSVAMVSVAVPLFVVVNLLARYRSSGIERVFLIGGVLALFLGAVWSMSDISDTLASRELLPDYIADVSGPLGVFSLLLGLFVVLYSLLRSGEDVEEIAERFYHLAEQMSEGFILSTADGMIFQVNNQFLRMFDLGREEILGRNSSDLAQQMHMTPMSQHLRSRMQGVASEYEITWRVRGEERRFWFHGTPIFDRQGRHTATLATVRDITELHRLSERVERYAEGLQKLVEEQTQKLRQSEDRFRQLLLTMNEGFLTLNARNRIHFANERLCEMLGLSADELLGRDIFELLDVPGRMRLFSMLTHDALEYRQEVTLVDKRGEGVPVMVAVAPIPESSEHDAVYSLVVTSMAEQKQMQRQLEMRASELERLNEELRMHDRAKDSFLSNVSHELRTPLSTIQGYIEMLESGSLGVMNGPQAGALKVMERNVQRLIGMINEMIEFSRMEIRGVQVSVTLFALPQLVREALASIHPHTIAKDITVNLFAEEGLALVWADRVKIGQVLGILLNNAVKFTDHGGMIQVRAFARPGNTLAIAVSDTGIGIDAVYHEKIFSKFFQVDSSKTRRYEGTGIGLPIAKSIVEAHGGTIEVQSAPGKGSIFTVVLPGGLFDSSVDEGTAKELSQARLLLVDQDQALYGILQGHFREPGSVFAKAPNGYEAVRAAESVEPHAVLINDSESDLAGLSTTGLLRQQRAFEETPIIVLTSEKPARLHEIRSMWNDLMFIRRPFTLQTLMSTIRSAFFDTPFASMDLLTHSLEDGTEAKPQVLFVDSDPGMLDWIEMALQRRQIPCYCTTTPQQALQWVLKQPPDVIFVDVDVPGAGVADRTSLFAKDPTTRTIPIYVMTGLPDEGLEQGVAGVLRKPFSIDEITGILQRLPHRTDREASASSQDNQ